MKRSNKNKRMRSGGRRTNPNSKKMFGHPAMNEMWMKFLSQYMPEGPGGKPGGPPKGPEGKPWMGPGPVPGGGPPKGGRPDDAVRIPEWWTPGKPPWMPPGWGLPGGGPAPWKNGGGPKPDGPPMQLPPWAVPFFTK